MTIRDMLEIRHTMDVGKIPTDRRGYELTYDEWHDILMMSKYPYDRVHKEWTGNTLYVMGVEWYGRDL